MKIKAINENGQIIALVNSETILIKDGSSALDFMMNISHEIKSRRIALNKEAIDEQFFDLRTGIAGDVLQKFVNYRIKFAIIGDFSTYTSKALKDFIFESNKGNSIFFVNDENTALTCLATAK